MQFQFEILAERKILEAIEDGVFDNVPGKGCPLNLESDASIPVEIRAAHRVLKNANAAPDWVQLNKALSAMIDECRRMVPTFHRRYEEYFRRVKSADIINTERIQREFETWYERSVNEYRNALREANGSIQKYNLIAPSCTQSHIPFRIDEEIARLTSVYSHPNRSES